MQVAISQCCCWVMDYAECVHASNDIKLIPNTQLYFMDLYRSEAEKRRKAAWLAGFASSGQVITTTIYCLRAHTCQLHI
jgi:sulfite reductase beta subunit-like hemoprotein